MKTTTQVAAILALLAWAVLGGILAYQGLTLPDRVAHDLKARLDRTEATLEREAAAWRRLADLHASASREATVQQLAQTNRILDRRAGELTRAVAKVAAVAPAAEALLTDAKDSWDDSYWDLKAAAESITVAARGVAEASEAVGKAAPAITESVATITIEAARVALSVATDVQATAKDVRTVARRAASPWTMVKGALVKVGKFLLKLF